MYNEYLINQLNNITQNLDITNIHHILDILILLIIKNKQNINDEHIDMLFNNLFSKIIEYYPEYKFINQLKDIDKSADIKNLLYYYMSSHLE